MPFSLAKFKRGGFCTAKKAQGTKKVVGVITARDNNLPRLLTLDF